ncbi:MAG: cyclodeaminase/cyclohydrolase family protein, partial [Saprospiraceae bacterium]|nr:cyclodeaminase/cyclohydrolase family protein [Saprospiraceae bacterium]
SFSLIRQMADTGNPNSVSDAGVAALCARAAVRGAFLNVKINAPGLDDKDFTRQVLSDGARMVAEADEAEKTILAIVEEKIGA